MAAIASATGEMKNKGAGFSRPFSFESLVFRNIQQKTPLERFTF
jgi:hypothetical protein